MSQAARIAGRVEYREGDGPNITIPKGVCEVEKSALDVTLGWADGASRGSASIPVSDYRRYLAEGAIVELPDGNGAVN